MSRLTYFVAVLAVLAAPHALEAREREVAVTLSGSRASMLRQNRIAKEEQYSFLRTPNQVRNFVGAGRLVPVEGNRDYVVLASYPVARPVVRAFVELLASRYREACGEKLVVTSLTRPATRQPSNASPLSVHPAGMAVDLRVSSRTDCSSWLKAELLDLEDMGLIDATLERNPPHFHIAVFPAQFGEYEQARSELDAEAEALRGLQEAMAARADSIDLAQAPPPAEAVIEPAPKRPGMLVLVAVVLARMLMPFSV